jgi:glycine/D-amino acid oxidase-like deaminating enzyme
MSPELTKSAVIIGGGFYGAAIAVYLAKKKGFKKIILLEREPSLLTRASYNNQARVHNGYHYPRSFTTAYRSRVNFPKFLRDWPSAVTQNFTKLYAIARHHSKVTAKQFQRFCREIGAEIQPVSLAMRRLFNQHLIEEVFLVEEPIFDATKLATWAAKELQKCGVEIHLNTSVTDIFYESDKKLCITTEASHACNEFISSDYVFNCTYSRLNQFTKKFPETQSALKHEITELALVQMPKVLEHLGVTIMDGPFFSVMPFPARSLHTLSHVRYTPHLYWNDAAAIDPYQKLAQYECTSRVDRMLRDATRYMPMMSEARYVESLFEVKTVLTRTELDDARPILFKKHFELPGCYSILGGKIDNIYDILEKLDSEFV